MSAPFIWSCSTQKSDPTESNLGLAYLSSKGWALIGRPIPTTPAMAFLTQSSPSGVPQRSAQPSRISSVPSLPFANELRSRLLRSNGALDPQHSKPRGWGTFSSFTSLRWPAGAAALGTQQRLSPATNGTGTDRGRGRSRPGTRNRRYRSPPAGCYIAAAPGLTFPTTDVGMDHVPKQAHR